MHCCFKFDLKSFSWGNGTFMIERPYLTEPSKNYVILYYSLEQFIFDLRRLLCICTNSRTKRRNFDISVGDGHKTFHDDGIIAVLALGFWYRAELNLFVNSCSPITRRVFRQPSIINWTLWGACVANAIDPEEKCCYLCARDLYYVRNSG